MHDCVATCSSNVIMKFADNTTISNSEETPYRDEVSVLGTWCQDNHFSLNVCKTKDFRKKRG